MCEPAGGMKSLQRTRPCAGSTVCPQAALRLSAASGSPQEDRSRRGWVRAPPGPADSSARPDGRGARDPQATLFLQCPQGCRRVTVGSRLGVLFMGVRRRDKGPDSSNPKSTRQNPSLRASVSGKGEYGVEEERGSQVCSGERAPGAVVQGKEAGMSVSFAA